MKLEIGNRKPENFAEHWPGQYDVFSHFEFAAGIPSVLHAVTTLKENGAPNVNFNFSGCFTGDGDGYFAVIPLYRHSHTYRNILRTGEFVVNFLGKAYFDACMATIQSSGDDADEFEAGGFHQEPSQTVGCPRMREAFLSLECKLERELDLSGSGRAALIIGRVTHIAAEAAYATGIDGKYGEDGFMINIHSPKNLITGAGATSAVAVLRVARVNEEG